MPTARYFGAAFGLPLSAATGLALAAFGGVTGFAAGDGFVAAGLTAGAGLGDLGAADDGFDGLVATDVSGAGAGTGAAAGSLENMLPQDFASSCFQFGP